MGTLIKNDIIQMNNTETGDLPFVMQAEQAAENQAYVGQWTHTQHEQAINCMDMLHLVICDSNERRVGYVILKGLKNQNNNIELVRIVITEKGCGYGRAALSLLKEWCFNIQKAHRLWLDVRENNYRALHVYKTQGFITDGILRECIKIDDMYHSLIIMSILNREYASI